MNRILTLILVAVLCLPMLVGCGSSSGNPTGTTLVQSSAQEDANFVRACFTTNVKRKFTYNKCSHQVHQQLRKGLQKLAARIRLAFLSDNNNEDINMVVNSMMVRGTDGQKYTFTEEANVNLLSAQSLSELLAEKELPEGTYNYIEFSIKSASIKEGNETFEIKVPTKKLRFTGNFELKDGYATTINIDWSHNLVKTLLYKAYEDARTTLGKVAAKAAMTLAWNGHIYKYNLVPVVKISSELTFITPEVTVTDGDINGSVTNCVSLAKVEGIAVTLEGTDFTTITDANGAFTFTGVPAGKYTVKASNEDYLDASFEVEVAAGVVSDVTVEMNPAVIKSTVGNTGWFSEFWPFADINGAYGEVGLEAPVVIDFVSLNFVRAEVSFNAKLHENGGARFESWLSTDQQVSADTELDGWWAGNSMHGCIDLGEYIAVSDGGANITIDITEQIKNNPSNIYYFAAHNKDICDIKLSDVQITIYYK